MGKQVEGALFMTDDYRSYVRAWAESRKRGEYRKIALALRMHTTLLSQVLSGRKNLTDEQAGALCDYLGLLPLETDYFLKLVQMERAGSESLKSIFRRQLIQMRDQAKEAKSRVPVPQEMSEPDRAIFYSSWHYSAIRIMTSLERFQTPGSLSTYLNLPASRVREVLEFLVSKGLCKVARDGCYKRTDKNTHVDARSPFAVRHHQNWRARAGDLQERMSSSDLAFTAPLSLAQKDVSKVRAILLDAIGEIAKLVEGSDSDEVVYLAVDWIKM